MIVATMILAASLTGQAPAPSTPGPAAKEAAKPAELTESRRRDIFNARWQAGMWAGGQADRRFPLDEMANHADDPGWGPRYLKARHDYYLERRTSARAAVARKFDLGPDVMDQVEKEGFAKKWKVSETPRLFDPSWVNPEPAPAKKSAARKKRR